MDDTNLTSLHRVIKDGLVAKLKAPGQQGNPPLGDQEVITVIVSARINPTVQFIELLQPAAALLPESAYS